MVAYLPLVMQHKVGVSWANWEGANGVLKVAPTLEAIPLRWGGIPTVLLAAGASQAAIVSEHGHVLDSFSLPVHSSSSFEPLRSPFKFAFRKFLRPCSSSNLNALLPAKFEFLDSGTLESCEC